MFYVYSSFFRYVFIHFGSSSVEVGSGSALAGLEVLDSDSGLDGDASWSVIIAVTPKIVAYASYICISSSALKNRSNASLLSFP
jgi:carbohydrate-binding DOMON domain-containing protein